MPYKRKGESEMNESLPNIMTPEEHNLAVKKYMETFIKDKKTWVDKYGLNRANFVMYKTAVKKAKEEFDKQNIEESKIPLKEAMTKEEFIEKLKPIIKDTFAKVNKAEANFEEYDELSKFPELKRVIVDLLSEDFNYFLASIDWVSPKPSTFRINLKNDHYFYLTYTSRSWIVQVEGKKYYLLNLPEEQKATEAISRVLRYSSLGERTDELSGEDGGGGEIDMGGETPPSEEPEETPEA